MHARLEHQKNFLYIRKVLEQLIHGAQYPSCGGVAQLQSKPAACLLPKRIKKRNREKVATTCCCITSSDDKFKTNLFIGRSLPCPALNGTCTYQTDEHFKCPGQMDNQSHTYRTKRSYFLIFFVLKKSNARRE